MLISAESNSVAIERTRREVLWNVPNKISLGRMASSPLLLLYPVFEDWWACMLFGFGFLGLSLTDLVDGYLARRHDAVTRIGKLLDPLADKLLVMTALVILVAVPDRIPLWGMPCVVAILGREFAVTGLRALASSEGVVIAADSMGKWKTGFQTAAITCLLVHFPFLGLPVHEIGLGLLAVATGLALWSGYGYVAGYLGQR